MPWLLHIPNDSKRKRLKLNQLFSNDQEDIQENPTIIERPVQLLDLFPTLVHLTDLGPPIKNCNKSLVIYKMFLV